MPIRIYTVNKSSNNIFWKGSNSWAIAAFLVVFALTPIPAVAMDMPWSISASAPILTSTPAFNSQDGGIKLTKNENRSLFNPFVFLVKGFQVVISPVDGARCSMYPTCSAYSLGAFRKHGTIKGLILTADRLLHEPDERDFAPIIVKHGVYRYYDPVERNDFWWY